MSEISSWEKSAPNFNAFHPRGISKKEKANKYITRNGSISPSVKTEEGRLKHWVGSQDGSKFKRTIVGANYFYHILTEQLI